MEIKNNYGEVVVINDTPYGWKNNWSKRLFKFFGLYFYVSTCRMKKRPKRDLMFNQFSCDINKKNKEKLYERQQGRCPECGAEVEYDAMELHHVLPYARYPELKNSIRNSVLLCHCCHKEVHLNPWKNIQMMKAKAAEMEIDLQERYDYGELGVRNE
jgi:hypothetical protein